MRGAFVAEAGETPVGFGGEAVTLDGAEGLCDALGDVGAAVEGYDASAAGYEVDEAFEGGFDGGEVGVDVSVVELDVGEDGGVGEVVEELGAFIEECRVVLIAFEDEGLCGADFEAGAEVFGYASDEEGWGEGGVLAAGDLEDPGEHAGCGGFSVGSDDDEGLACGEELVVEDGGHGGEGDAVVEDEFELGVAAGDGVADDDEVGAGGEVGLGVGLEDGDAEGGELVAHGRVGCGVGAGDAVSLLLEHACE